MLNRWGRTHLWMPKAPTEGGVRVIHSGARPSSGGSKKPDEPLPMKSLIPIGGF